MTMGQGLMVAGLWLGLAVFFVSCWGVMAHLLKRTAREVEAANRAFVDLALWERELEDY